MIHLLALALTALHLTDPIGDAVGDGSLTPPTAPVYADLADFDLERVSLLEGDTLRVRVAMGQLGNPADLPNGFSSAVIEVYLDTAPGGAETLLPGSGMRMPPGRGWEVALRLTGDVAQRVEARAQGDPAGWPREPVAVQVDGNALVVDTGLPRPRGTELFAITGVYDPFAQDAWRPVSPTPSPWAFSSASQRLPVVDVLANDATAQRRAIDSGVLPTFRGRAQGVGWLWLMLAGVVLAGGGVVLRRRVRSSPTARAPRAAETLPTAAAAPARRSPLEHVADTFLDEATEAALWPDAEQAVARAAQGAGGHGAGPAGAGPAGAEGVESEGMGAEGVHSAVAESETLASDRADSDRADSEQGDSEQGDSDRRGSEGAGPGAGTSETIEAESRDPEEATSGPTDSEPTTSETSESETPESARSEADTSESEGPESERPESEDGGRTDRAGRPRGT